MKLGRLNRLARVVEANGGVYAADMSVRFREYSKIYPARTVFAENDSLNVHASDIPKEANAVSITPGPGEKYSIRFYRLGERDKDVGRISPLGLKVAEMAVRILLD